MSHKLQKDDVSVAILAGGKSSRMEGKDKGLIRFNGKLVLSRIISIANEFSSDVFVIANNNLKEYEKIHKLLYTDILDDFQGPLSGIYTALKKCKNHKLVVLPCDGPFINKAYFETLLNHTGNSSIKVIRTGDRLQPVYACIDSSLANNLQEFLQSGERKIDKWYTSCGFDEVLFNHDNEMFLNINSKEDIEINKELISKIYG